MPGDGPENADYQLGMWLVSFENFTSPEEAEHMIQLAADQGYERSADVGEELPDGSFADDINSGRTSENAWCDDDCFEDPVAQSIMRRIEHITGINMDNQESLQQLRYRVGEVRTSFVDEFIHHVCFRFEILTLTLQILVLSHSP
jgi:prolyl 4-hydroxylase